MGQYQGPAHPLGNQLVPPGGPRVFLVNLPVCHPIKRHGRRPGEDHGQKNQQNDSALGNPCAATIIEPAANGSAKTVWENRMNFRMRWM